MPLLEIKPSENKRRLLSKRTKALLQAIAKTAQEASQKHKLSYIQTRIYMDEIFIVALKELSTSYIEIIQKVAKQLGKEAQKQNAS